MHLRASPDCSCGQLQTSLNSASSPDLREAYENLTLLMMMLLLGLAKYAFAEEDQGPQDVIPVAQSGFRPNRGTNDMIFAARQLQEKCREQHRDLYRVFINLTKAFDMVSRSGLWLLLRKFGCTEKFTKILKSLHEGMLGRVNIGREFSEPFGVRQGCVAGPILFNLFYAAMLSEATRDLPCGVYIRLRTSGKLFNLSRLRASTKVFEQVLSRVSIRS